MSVSATMDHLIKLAAERGAKPLAFRIEKGALIQLAMEAVERGWLRIATPRTMTRYRGIPIEETEPGTGITIRTEI
jgi:uncharacterized membrane protein